jgi:hypothetical protein
VLSAGPGIGLGAKKKKKKTCHVLSFSRCDHGTACAERDDERFWGMFPVPRCSVCRERCWAAGT